MDNNQIVFNDFNITIDKPEKDWGVGFHIVGDFGACRRTASRSDFSGVPISSRELAMEENPQPSYERPF